MENMSSFDLYVAALSLGAITGIAIHELQRLLGRFRDFRYRIRRHLKELSEARERLVEIENGEKCDSINLQRDFILLTKAFTLPLDKGVENVMWMGKRIGDHTPEEFKAIITDMLKWRADHARDRLGVFVTLARKT